MAKDKTSFILYADQRSYFDKLSNEEAGILIKHIFSYVNDECPEPIDRITDLSFEPIKLQLKRDLKKYEKVVDRNRENGKLGGRPSKQNKPKKPSGLIENPSKPKKADNDNVNDNDNIKVYSVLSPPDGVDVLHFYIAKSFHKMFYDAKKNKSLKEAKLNNWVNTVRLILEVDEIPTIQLVGIKHFLQAGINKDKGVKSFWSDTIFSINALRKKSDDGTYYIDRIKQDAKRWIERNPEKEEEIYKAHQRLIEAANG